MGFVVFFSGEEMMDVVITLYKSPLLEEYSNDFQAPRVEKGFSWIKQL